MTARKHLRATSAIVAMALLPSLAPDVFAVSCPHHVAHGAAGMPEAGLGGDETSNRPSAGAHHHGTTDDGGSSHGAHHSMDGRTDGSTGGHGEPCTCVGQCPVSQVPTIPTHRTVERSPADASARSVDTVWREAPLLAPPPYLQPPANAPPLT